MALENAPLAGRVSAALATLRALGERVTPARRAVLEILDVTEQHLNAEEVAALVSQRAPGVHRATVYRALSTLSDLGVVTHIHVGGSATVYHLSTPGPHEHARADTHAHLQCTRCRAVLDIAVDNLRPLADRLSLDLDFQLEPAHTALLGICGKCRRR